MVNAVFYGARSGIGVFPSSSSLKKHSEYEISSQLGGV